MIRTGFLLVAVVVIGHSMLQWGRVYVVNALEDTYGSIAIDEQGRLRHWDGSFDHYYWFLSADEVEGPGGWTEDDWFQHAGIPVSTGVTRAPPQSKWLGLKPDRPTVAGTVGFGLGAGGSTMLMVRPDGSAYIRCATTGADGEVAIGERVPVEGEVSYPPRVEGQRFVFGFVGFVNDEYWVVNRDGQVMERQPVGIDLPTPVTYGAIAWSKKGEALLTLVEGPVRPDRMAVRVILFRRGQEPISRLATMEPVTEEQLWNASLLGVLGALRPVPLLLAAMANDVPPTRLAMLKRWWLDPYFAQGANSGWLGAAVMLTLLCTILAFRWARLRCASLATQAFWVVAVAALGPMGLIWMRLALPWYAIENGRAVNLGEWPNPELTGTEVFA